MLIRQETERRSLDEVADRCHRLLRSTPLPQDDERTFCMFEHARARLTASGAGSWARAAFGSPSRVTSCRFGVHHLTEQLGRQIEIDAARAAENSRADRARQAMPMSAACSTRTRLAERLAIASWSISS